MISAKLLCLLVHHINKGIYRACNSFGKDKSGIICSAYCNSGGKVTWGVFEGGNGYDGEVNTRAEDVLHSEVMWRTYRSRAFLEGPGNDNWDWGRATTIGTGAA